MGTTQMLSTRIPAENPASISAPKLLTTDWTSIIPIDTVDCCRMEGRAILAMPVNSPWSNRPAPPSPSYRLISCKKSRKEKAAEIPWAIKVAQATPATPIPSSRTRTTSRTMLKTEEKISRYRGILDFPRALNIEERILYMNKKGRPKK